MFRGDPSSFLHLLSVAAIPGLFAITLHEVAHGWMARWFGDRSAEFLGRLSLNPLRHVDPVGTVLMPLMTLWMGGLVFGWAKPVPVNARALRNPERNMVVIAAAGPLANLAMAVAWAVLLRFTGETAGVAARWVTDMASFGIYFNGLLAVFNLLPVPPLDGGRVLRGILPRRLALRLDAIEPYGLILVMGLLLTGVLGRFMGPVLDAVMAVVLTFAGARG